MTTKTNKRKSHVFKKNDAPVVKVFINQPHPNDTKTLRQLYDVAIVEGKVWSVKNGHIELVHATEDERPYNRDVELQLKELGLRWIWL
jgi:hypothetical protein